MGSIAVVDAQGRLLASAGDPDFLTFARSTTKPFQALPFMLADGMNHAGFSIEQVAMLCASHSGEPRHVNAVSDMLARTACHADELQCGCHTPIAFDMPGSTTPAGFVPTTLHHNCSGKHAGFLAYCAQHGLSRNDYLNEQHPLQLAIRQHVAQACGTCADALISGIDGCSAPTFALPLQALATGYAAFATADPQGSGQAAALATLFRAMVEHPIMVSGTGRSDLAFMNTAPGDWVAKVGADGVQVMGIRSQGLGIALKMADGDMRACYVATVEVLRQLGLVTDPAGTPLAPWVRPAITNVRGLRTGEIRPAFTLVRH